MKYLNDNWLGDYKEKFVSAWTHANFNFGQNTTNRVESQHAKLKRSIKGANSSLHRLVMLVDQVLDSQRIAINHSFQVSRSIRMVKHNVPMFADILGEISHTALDLLLLELQKIEKLRAQNKACGHGLLTSCGLPCACRLEAYIEKGNTIFYTFCSSCYYYYYYYS